MAVSLTSIVIGVISALVLALLVLGIVIFLYLKSRRHLEETRRVRIRRRRAPLKQTTTDPIREQVEPVASQPMQLQSLNPYRPTSYLTNQMYLPPVRRNQWTDEAEAAAAQQLYMDVVRRSLAIQPSALDDFSNVLQSRRALSQELPIVQQRIVPVGQQMRQPLAIRNTEPDDYLMDEVSNSNVRRERKNKQSRDGKKMKKDHNSAYERNDAVTMAMTMPQGTYETYPPQLIPLNNFQHVVQVHAVPTPVTPFQPVATVPGVVNPPTAVASSTAQSASPAPLTASSAVNQDPPPTVQQTTNGEITWTRVNDEPDNAFGGFAASSGINGFGGQSAVFSASRTPAHRDNSSLRQYEDQERAVNIAVTSGNR